MSISLKAPKRPFGLLRIGLSVILLTLATAASAFIAVSGFVPATAYAASSSVNVWWPTANQNLSGAQPFKAAIDGMPLDSYYMFWQVDNGGYNMMSDSQTDAPHKEAAVDLSGWNWNSNGSYTVNFIAQDLAGHEIARSTVVIKHGSQQSPVNQSSSVVNSVPTTSTTATAPIVSSTPAAVITATVVSAPAATVTVSAPAAQTAAPASIAVWWPAPNATMSGVQPIKAVLTGKALGDYSLSWSVDGGNQVAMADSYVDGAHKEVAVDFSGWTWKDSGQYAITLTAKDKSGNVVATASVPIHANAKAAQTSSQITGTLTTSPATPAKATAPATAFAQTAPVAAPAPASSNLSSKLYVDPNNPATAQAMAWASSDPKDSAFMAKIGAQSVGIWLGGWNGNVQSDVSSDMKAAAGQGSAPIFVAYNIPGRDCGGYSAGGATDSSSYLSWINQVSAGLGKGNAIMVLEPDALASMSCLSQSQQTDRYSMLSQAVNIFKANNPGTRVYIDAGHSGWVDASTMASQLKRAGIANAAGFSLNVSNFVKTDDNVAYGQQVSGMAGGAHFVVDTSRNGNGSNGQWCNPSGMALGRLPTLSTGNPLVDAYLWIKRPGESDGNCNGGPSAGNWWSQYAVDLAKNAGY